MSSSNLLVYRHNGSVGALEIDNDDYIENVIDPFVSAVALSNNDLSDTYIRMEYKDKNGKTKETRIKAGTFGKGLDVFYSDDLENPRRPDIEELKQDPRYSESLIEGVLDQIDLLMDSYSHGK